MKRLFALLLCLMMVLSLLPAAAAEEIEIIDFEAEEGYDPADGEELIALIPGDEPMGSAPTVTVQPKSVTAFLGTTVTFTVKASGAESYQWYFRTSSSGSWTKCSGGTDTALTVEAKAYRSGYQYRCKLTNGTGHTFSSAATLTVSKKPVITSQPVDAAGLGGSTLVFSVAADGAETCQWYYRSGTGANWKPCSNGTGMTLSVEVKSYRDGYQYRCKLTNGAGSVYSDTATLKLLKKPVITTQPMDYTACVGAKLYLQVAADHTDSYQWYYRTSKTGSWKKTALAGCQTATLTVKVTEARNGWQYRCKLTGTGGSVYSDPATLIVSNSSCGEGLTWKLSSSGLLTIGGSGDMYSWEGESPWAPYIGQVRHVTIGNSVSSIGDQAFSGFENLTGVTIGSGVRTIGKSAFQYCYNLTSVMISTGTEEIGENAFCYCTGLESISIPDSVTVLGDNAFDSCSSLTNVKLSRNLTSIGAWAFYDCTDLETVEIPDSVTSVEYGAFYNCHTLKNVVFGKNLVSIGVQSFSSTALESVSLPDSVANIGSSAFSRCENLTRVTIGTGVTMIGSSAFSSCTQLADVYYRGSEAQWNEIEIGNNNKPLLDASRHYNYLG